MVRNRLAELHKKDSNDEQHEKVESTSKLSNIFSLARRRRTPSQVVPIQDEDPVGGNTAGGYLGDLSKEILEITQTIETIEQNVLDIHDLYSKTLSTVDTQSHDYLMTHIQELSDDTNRMIANLNARIKNIPDLLATADPRLVNTQQYTLVKRLITTTNQYQDIQNKAKAQMNAQLQRQYQIAKPDASQEELESIDAKTIKNGAVFKEAIVELSAERQQIEQVKQRHDEIQQIEKSIETLFQSFQDMQNILITNQLMLNSIESFMNHTILHIDGANDDVKEAIKLSKVAKKKKIILCGFLVSIIIITAIVLIVLFKLNIVSKQSN